MKRRRIVTLSAAATVFAVAAAVPASAYFQADEGSENGFVPVSTLQPVVLSALAGELPDTPLQPGASGDVVMKLNNPNPFTVKLVSATAIGDIVVTGLPGCTLVNAGVSYTDQTALSVPVAPGDQVVRLPGAASMDIGSDNTCQGATFAIPVTIRVETTS